MNSKLVSFFAFVAIPFTSGLSAQEEDWDPSLDGLFPIPEDIRDIIDRQCVFCHGELVLGEPEIREDLDMSTDEKIKETLIDLWTLEEVIEEDEMPQEAKLSYRLRRIPDMQQRLDKIKESYEANGEKAKLLAWIKAAAEAE